MLRKILLLVFISLLIGVASASTPRFVTAQPPETQVSQSWEKAVVYLPRTSKPSSIDQIKTDKAYPVAIFMHEWGASNPIQTIMTGQNCWLPKGSSWSCLIVWRELTVSRAAIQRPRERGFFRPCMVCDWRKSSTHLNRSGSRLGLMGKTSFLWVLAKVQLPQYAQK